MPLCEGRPDVPCTDQRNDSSVRLWGPDAVRGVRESTVPTSRQRQMIGVRRPAMSRRLSAKLASTLMGRVAHEAVLALKPVAETVVWFKTRKNYCRQFCPGHSTAIAAAAALTSLLVTTFLSRRQ